MKATKYIVLICLTVSLNSVFAQKNSLPSRSKKSFTVDSAAFYLDSARILSDKAPIKALNYINKAIEESIRNNNTSNEAAAYIVLGNLQQQLEQHDLAIGSYKKSISALADKSEKKDSYSKPAGANKNIFIANKQLTVSYIALNKFNDASISINKCLNETYANISQSEKMDVLRLSALVKQKQKKYKESLKILSDVYAEEVKNGNLYGQVITDIAIGKVNEENNNDKVAITYYTRAKNVAEKNNFNKLAIEANDMLAGVYRIQKNVNKELEARNSIIELNKGSKKAKSVQKENMEMGNAYYNNNQLDKAEAYYEKAQQSAAATDDMATGEVEAPSAAGSQPQKLFEKSKDIETNSSTYKLLTEEYLKRNELKKAADYFKLYTELQDSLKNTRKQEFDNAISLSNSIGQNQQRISLLETERELREKSIQVLEQDKALNQRKLELQNIIIGVLILCILSMILAGYFVYKSFKAKRKIHQTLALKSLRGQMNPHFIFNALNSVNHYIAQNDERLANRYLSDFSKLMRLVMDSSKHDFISMSEELEMLKIYLQLEHLRFSDKFEYTIHFTNEADLMDYEIPPMLVQPYIENAIWHGLRYIDEKGSLHIEFEAKNKNLQITIADNGIGRKRSKELKTLNQKKQQSVGMQNIESRIELMNEIFNTRISVEVADRFPDAEHTGTIVKLSIPQKHLSNA